MTKFKKCDYCLTANSTVTKYKTAFGKFGTTTHAHNTMAGYIGLKVVDQFYLCKDCLDFLIPEDKILRYNKIDNDFFEEVLRQKLGIKKRPITPPENVRKGSNIKPKNHKD